MALQIGKADMYVSGKITRLALLEVAFWIRVVAFWVVLEAERKIEEAWQAAARRTLVVMVEDDEY